MHFSPTGVQDQAGERLSRRCSPCFRGRAMFDSPADAFPAFSTDWAGAHLSSGCACSGRLTPLVVKLYSAGFWTCFSSASTGLCRPQHPSSTQGIVRALHVREQRAYISSSCPQCDDTKARSGSARATAAHPRDSAADRPNLVPPPTSRHPAQRADAQPTAKSLGKVDHVQVPSNPHAESCGICAWPPEVPFALHNAGMGMQARQPAGMQGHRHGHLSRITRACGRPLPQHGCGNGQRQSEWTFARAGAPCQTNGEVLGGQARSMQPPGGVASVVTAAHTVSLPCLSTRHCSGKTRRRNAWHAGAPVQRTRPLARYWP